jgi:hypothetical protein
MGIEYEKELYSRMESLRSELEAEYNRNSLLVAELKVLRSDLTMTAAWERRALDAEAEIERATAYLRNLVCAFCKEHFPENTEWRPLPDLLGMLTQMDNASTVVRDYRAKLREAVEVIRPFAGSSITFKDFERARAFLAAMEKPRD